MAINREAEIEKIADKLGIGKDRDIECVGCQKTFRFKDAIILHEGEESKYLCKDCYQKVLDGKLKDSTEDLLKKLIEAQEIKKADIQPAPFIPGEEYPPMRWEPTIYKVGDRSIEYTVRHTDKDNTSFMALIPNDPTLFSNKV